MCVLNGGDGARYGTIAAEVNMDLDLFKPRSRPDLESIERVKGWVTSALELPASTSVMVTELACSEPGCPPLETVIAVLAQEGPKGRRQHTFHKPLTDVSWADVIHLANLWHPLEGG
jgi:hypothetical protein